MHQAKVAFRERSKSWRETLTRTIEEKRYFTLNIINIFKIYFKYARYNFKYWSEDWRVFLLFLENTQNNTELRGYIQ